MAAVVAALALLAISASAHPHEHVSRGIANGVWYHERDHPVSALFARAPGGPAPGSPQWLAQYPPAGGAPSQVETDIPKPWLDAYNAVKAAGKIPNIPVSQLGPGFPQYGGLDPTGPVVCSSTPKCRAAGDIWDAPDGYIGLSFDDGPWKGTDKLLNYLGTINQPVTHYLIGRNVAQWPQNAIRAFQAGHELAVHTWSHPAMTNQTDYGVLVELGWTMQIIHDLTGGRVPKFWRPPTGDCDNRVRAIAKEVFGLTVVFWNQDTEDWSLNDPVPIFTGPQTSDILNKWLGGPKHPGLIILQHELTDDTVEIWINTTWPGVKQFGWKPSPIAAMFNLPTYQNAKNNQGAVTPMDNMAAPVPPGAGGGTGSSSTGSNSGSSVPPTNTGSSTGPSPSTTPPPGGAASHLTASITTAAIAALLASMLV